MWHRLRDKLFIFPPKFGSIDRRSMNNIVEMDFSAVQQYLNRWLPTTGSLSPWIPSHSTSDIVRPFFEELWSQDQRIQELLRGALLDEGPSPYLMSDHGAFLNLPPFVQHIDFSDMFFRNLLLWLRQTYLGGSLKGSVEQSIEHFFEQPVDFVEWYQDWQAPYDTTHDISDQHGFQLTLSFDVDQPFAYSWASVLLLGRLIRYVRPAHKVPHLMIRVIKKTRMDIQTEIHPDFWVHATSDMTFSCCNPVSAYWLLGDCSEAESKVLCNPEDRPRVEWDIGMTVKKQTSFPWWLGACVSVGDCRQLCTLASAFTATPWVVDHNVPPAPPLEVQGFWKMGNSGDISVQYKVTGNPSQVCNVVFEGSFDHYTWFPISVSVATLGSVSSLVWDSTTQVPQVASNVYLRCHFVQGAQTADAEVGPFMVDNLHSVSAPAHLILGDIIPIQGEEDSTIRLELMGDGITSDTVLRFRYGATVHTFPVLMDSPFHGYADVDLSLLDPPDPILFSESTLYEPLPPGVLLDVAAWDRTAENYLVNRGSLADVTFRYESGEAGSSVVFSDAGKCLYLKGRGGFKSFRAGVLNGLPELQTADFTHVAWLSPFAAGLNINQWTAWDHYRWFFGYSEGTPSVKFFESFDWGSGFNIHPDVNVSGVGRQGSTSPEGSPINGLLKVVVMKQGSSLRFLCYDASGRLLVETATTVSAGVLWDPGGAWFLGSRWTETDFSFSRWLGWGRALTDVEIQAVVAGSGLELQDLIGGVPGFSRYHRESSVLVGYLDDPVRGILSNSQEFLLHRKIRPVVSGVSIASLPGSFPVTVTVSGNQITSFTRAKVSNQVKLSSTPGSGSVSVEVAADDVKFGRLCFSLVDLRVENYESNVIFVE